jgi:hypothetical protein
MAMSPVGPPSPATAVNRRDRPFTLERFPGGVVPHRTWREARAGILSALEEGKRIIVLLGEPGAGKTLMLHEIGRDPVAKRLDLKLVDDADRVPPSALSGAGRGSEGPWLLAGQRGFKQRAKLWGDAARIVWLRPMPAEEVDRFLDARLKLAGRRRDTFAPEAVTDLARRSEGLPRRVLLLAGDALREAESAGAERVTPAHVRAAAERRIIQHPLNSADHVVPLAQQLPSPPPPLKRPGLLRRLFLGPRQGTRERPAEPRLVPAPARVPQPVALAPPASSPPPAPPPPPTLAIGPTEAVTFPL